MKCFMCDKQLNNIKSKKFVSICLDCIDLMEKSEARQMDMVTLLRKEIIEINEIKK